MAKLNSEEFNFAPVSCLNAEFNFAPVSCLNAQFGTQSVDIATIWNPGVIL